MSAYVDPAVFKKSPTGRKSYCHMVADTLDELHLFALQIGVKRHFFHRTPGIPHYDLTDSQRAIALNAGAHEVDSREIVRIAKKAHRLAF